MTATELLSELQNSIIMPTLSKLAGAFQRAISALHLLLVDLESLGRESCLHGGLLAVVESVVDDT